MQRNEKKKKNKPAIAAGKRSSSSTPIVKADDHLANSDFPSD